MGNSYDKVATRWVDRALGRTDRANLTNWRMPTNRDTIYSYGHHFPLAIAQRDKRGAVRGFLLNGDRVSVTTTRHQRVVRDALRVHAGHVPSVIVPFSALDAAGIVRESVELVTDEPERNETIRHEEATSWPFRREGTWWRWEDVTRRADDWEREQMDAIRRALNGMARLLPADRWARSCSWDPWNVPTGARRAVPYVGPARLPWDHDHDPIPTESAAAMFAHLVWVASGGVMGIDARTLPAVESLPPVVWRWTTHRHWLGESVIRAKVRTRPVACRACQATGQGIGPAVPRWSDYREEWVGGYVTCPRCNGRGTRRPERWAYFLSGFDMNESRPLYFLCELPRVDFPPESIADAYRILKPDAVLLAESMGKEVARQGDIFAIPTTFTTRQLKRVGGEHHKRGHNEANVTLLGTNHTASEVIRLPDGTTLARGTMRHEPGAWRQPDHARRTIGKAWHVILKNTVPVTR